MPIFTFATDLSSGLFIWIGTYVSNSNPARLAARPGIDQALVTTGRQFQKLQKLLDSRPLAPIVFLDHLVAKIIIFPIRLCLGHVSTNDLLRAERQVISLEKSLEELRVIDKKNNTSIRSLHRTIDEQRVTIASLQQIKQDKEKEIKKVSKQNEQLREEEAELHSVVDKLAQDNLSLLKEQEKLEASKKALEQECTDLEQTVLQHSQLTNALAQTIFEQNDLLLICQQIGQDYKRAAPLSKAYQEKLMQETQKIAQLTAEDLFLKQEKARLEALLGEQE